MSEVFPTFGKPTAVIALFACDRPVLGDAIGVPVAFGSEKSLGNFSLAIDKV